MLKNKIYKTCNMAGKRQNSNYVLISPEDKCLSWNLVKYEESWVVFPNNPILGK